MGVGGRAQSAMAADIENGASVFGGNYAVVAEKKLKKEALTQFGMYDIEKIKTQVTNGKNAMPLSARSSPPTTSRMSRPTSCRRRTRAGLRPWGTHCGMKNPIFPILPEASAAACTVAYSNKWSLIPK